MIENIRKYTGLIVVVIVVLLLGFILMDTQSFFRNSAAGGGSVKVNGRTYSQAEYIDLGAAPFRLASGLQSFDSNGFEIMGFVRSMVAGAQTEDQAEMQFFVSRMILREAREEFGIHPSDEAVQTFIKELTIFHDRSPFESQPGTPSEFDQEKYNDFVNKTLKRVSLNEKAFHELIRDVIAASKLRDLIGGGLPGSTSLAKASVASREQKIKAGLAPVNTKAIREGLTPTDEELKTFWETVKEKYQTEARIKVTYLLASPTYPDDLKAPAATPPADETAEQKTAREAAEAAKAEQRKKIDKEFAIELNNFFEQLTTSEGADFQKLVEDRKWTLTSTDWITPTTLPAPLQAATRGTSVDKSVSTELFRLRKGSDPLAAFTLPLAVGEHDWLVARLDETEEPRTKTYEEAAEEVKKEFLAQKADELVRKQVEEKIAAIQKAIEGGQSFADAAKAAGLEPREIGPFAQADTPAGEADAAAIFAAASTVAPGAFADTLFKEDEALLIHVLSREIVKDDTRAARVDTEVTTLLNSNQAAAFSAWLLQRVEQAAPEAPES
ncbi:MAG: SurA N-terminal domain-containing protein [Akkermansiaceae bacterium]|jgi:hypothetical protein|nr:SurA N-terminal domain-containing protein [Akkermansiaceae bacterium]